MKVLIGVLVVSAWACVFFAPKGGASRFVQFLCFGLPGILLCLFGGFSLWWDASMRPKQKSAYFFVCGILLVVSQAGLLLRMVLDDPG